MTTAAAAQAYLEHHISEYGGRKYAVFNPHNKPVNELPFIYGFNNGGNNFGVMGQLIAQDGAGLGGHFCSNEGYMRHDLGIYEGSRPDRHEAFQKHYPDGYRMEFVGYDDVPNHAALNKAFSLNTAKNPVNGMQEGSPEATPK